MKIYQLNGTISSRKCKYAIVCYGLPCITYVFEGGPQEHQSYGRNTLTPQVEHKKNEQSHEMRSSNLDQSCLVSGSFSKQRFCTQLLFENEGFFGTRNWPIVNAQLMMRSSNHVIVQDFEQFPDHETPNRQFPQPEETHQDQAGTRALRLLLTCVVCGIKVPPRSTGRNLPKLG